MMLMMIMMMMTMMMMLMKIKLMLMMIKMMMLMMLKMIMIMMIMLIIMMMAMMIMMRTMNTYNYSFTLDISIQDPYISLNKGYSVIFSRGGTVNPSPQANSSIKGSISNYNVAIALAPGNTDLVVSVLNSDGNPDNILIPNVPVQTPFRVGVVIMSTVFEVYLNGKLVSTRKLTSGATGNYTGPFRAPDGPVARAVRVGNLLVWNRVASPGNIRYAKPPLMSPIDKDAVSSGGSCESGNVFSDSTSFIDTLSKNANDITTSATATLGSTATAASDAVSDFSE